jgi:DivIVA domain-containing protein/excisionase family DNA binding protein
MDHEDSEDRIAELVTPQDIHDVAFSKPAIGHRGYDEDEVDEFLGRVEKTLCDPTASAGVTSAEIDIVSFAKPPIGRRGYACRLSRNTVRRMIEDGRLPAVRIGQQWRIRPEHVRNILGVPA